MAWSLLRTNTDDLYRPIISRGAGAGKKNTPWREWYAPTRGPMIRSVVKFGLCTSLSDRAALQAARDAGWDYLEAPATSLLQATDADDARWAGPRLVHDSPLPILACNMLLPPTHRIAGIHAEPFQLHNYLETLFRRAQSLGIQTLVFGSGAARKIPDDIDRSLGLRQVIDFLQILGDLANRHNVTVALEHLNRSETNVLNTLAECTAVARSLSLPRLRVLLDTYHLWTEEELLSHVEDALPLLAHVHLADLAGRLAPGEASPSSDYRPLFRLLKEHGYSGTISVEALSLTPPAYPRVLDFLKEEWQQA